MGATAGTHRQRRSSAESRTRIRSDNLPGDVGADPRNLAHPQWGVDARRLVMVTAFALVLTGIVTALAIEARIARKAAEESRKQAENLVALRWLTLRHYPWTANSSSGRRQVYVLHRQRVPTEADRTPQPQAPPPVSHHSGSRHRQLAPNNSLPLIHSRPR